MARQSHINRLTSVPGLTRLFGSAVMANPAAITSQSFKGATLTKEAAAGVYTLTFNEVWPGGMLCLDVVGVHATAESIVAAVTEDGSADTTKKYVKFTLLAHDGAALDVQNATGLRIMATMKNSTVPNG